MCLAPSGSLCIAKWRPSVTVLLTSPKASKDNAVQRGAAEELQLRDIDNLEEES